MTTITVEEIQRDLLGFLRHVEDGETIFIVREEKLVAKLKPAHSG